jgi:predicted RNase H-like HicB family nuclease
LKGIDMKITFESEQETDGRWLAEVMELPGVLAYGKTSDEAIRNALALALRVIADRIEHGEEIPAETGETILFPFQQLSISVA